MKVLDEYYNKIKLEDNLPIPNKINHYFVELGDDDDYKLEQSTINTLADIMKQSMFSSPISNTKEKIIVEIKRKRNCQESIKKYDRIIKDQNGTLKKVTSKLGVIAGGSALSGVISYVGRLGMTAVGITSVPVIIIGGVVGTGIGLMTQIKGLEKLDEVDFAHCVDDKYQNEDYITFDEEIIIYHDGTSETRRINIDYYTRIIST